MTPFMMSLYESMLTEGFAVYTEALVRFKLVKAM